MNKALTVIIDPQRKVLRGDISPGLTRSSPTPKSILTTSLPSPAKIRRGNRTMALSKLVYQDKARALPPTTVKLCLITTEWMAVIAELATPKPTPTKESSVPSRKTPTKNPSVTSAQQRRIRSEGREWRTMNEVQTVNGSTMPRATW